MMPRVVAYMEGETIRTWETAGDSAVKDLAKKSIWVSARASSDAEADRIARLGESSRQLVAGTKDHRRRAPKCQRTRGVDVWLCRRDFHPG